ncbi:MAG: response regulator transcription factor [Hyphomicrobiales bacterium]|nr:response regulator transcription factor [Rickettsiales bacterium]MCP5361591.1 response regulator transcription factor [Hyphomicrobiales bacterium]
MANILILEDNKEYREALVAALEAKGHTVTATFLLEEFLNKLGIQVTFPNDNKDDQIKSIKEGNYTLAPINLPSSKHYDIVLLDNKVLYSRELTLIGEREILEIESSHAFAKIQENDALKSRFPETISLSNGGTAGIVSKLLDALQRNPPEDMDIETARNDIYRLVDRFLEAPRPASGKPLPETVVEMVNQTLEGLSLENNGNNHHARQALATSPDGKAR